MWRFLNLCHWDVRIESSGWWFEVRLWRPRERSELRQLCVAYRAGPEWVAVVRTEDDAVVDK